MSQIPRYTGKTEGNIPPANLPPVPSQTTRSASASDEPGNTVTYGPGPHVVHTNHFKGPGTYNCVIQLPGNRAEQAQFANDIGSAVQQLYSTFGPK